MIVRTPKLADGDLLKLVRELLRIYPEGSSTASLAEGVRRDFNDQRDIDRYEFDLSSRHIQSLNFQFQRVEPDVVVFQRGTADPEYLRSHAGQTGFSKRVPSAYYDELGFFGPHSRSGNYQPLTDEHRIAVSELLNSYAAPTDAASDEEARQLSKVVSKQIDDLRRLNLKMTEGLAEARKRDEEDFKARQTELDASFKSRLDELAQKEADLEKRRAELNDREPQHERRRLREHLTERLQATIAEPPRKATDREWWSNIFYLAVGAIFVAISILLALDSDVGNGTDSAAFWARSFKSLVSGIAGAAFAWAGLAGLKASARAAREYEQQIQRYAFDMDRASWVVETLLQMNSIEKAQVPEEWLEAACRDLFLVAGQKTDDTRSLEAFAALFDATAKARIGTSGVEFEIDRKGARKLAHE